MVFFVFLLAPGTGAKPKSAVKFTALRKENPRITKEVLVLPYAFSSNSLGTTFGVGGGIKGYGQDQLLVGGTVFTSSDEASGFVGGMWDYQVPGTRRLYFSLIGSMGYYPRQRAYSEPYFIPGKSRFGDNDSDKNEYYEASGQDNWFDLKLEYVLPMGDARNRERSVYHLSNGMVTDARKLGPWNPLERGVTVLMLLQYNHYQSFETTQGVFDRTIHPIEFAILYDHTDFPSNPSCGSSQYLAVTSDFVWLETKSPWTFIEFEASKYFSLGKTDRARQRVVAFNFWTGDSPSWKERTDENGNIVVLDKPPYYEGANLGGMYRMRAYPRHRFNGRSVIYVTTEYRYTPEWNPLGNMKWLKFLKIDWWQFVGFIEGGRVANSYNLSDLSKNWKIDGGLAVRSMMAGAVIRLDIGFCDEGSNFWVMFGHPF